MPPRAESINTNGVKGLLIALVVFGHMYAVQHSFFRFYSLLYIFHVAGFLVLPFLAPSPALSRSFIAKRTLRYVVPFLWFYAAASTIFAALFLLPKGISLATIAFADVQGLLIASAKYLDAASGLKLFWFLPALLSLTLLRAANTSLPKGGRVLLFILGLATNMFVMELADTRHLLPWGLPIALAIFPVGVMCAAIINYGQTDAPFRRMLAVLAVMLLALSWQLHVYINVGDIQFYSLARNPVMWLVSNATMVTVVAAIILFYKVWLRLPLLSFLGSLSLPVYLIHAFINQGQERALSHHINVHAPQSLWITYPLVLATATLLAWGLTRLPWVNGLVFPRDATSLKAVCTDIRKKLVNKTSS